jgi:hypothetical protein
MLPEIRKAPQSGEFFIINKDNSYELVDSYGDEPRSCDFRPVHTSKVLEDPSIKKISPSEVEPYVKRGFILFLFGEMKW